MNGRLAARELHHLGLSLWADVIIEHLFDLFQGEVESGAGLGKAQWAIHIAGAVHLDNSKAGVLLMVWAQSAIVGASVADFATKRQRNRPGLVVTGLRRVRF